MFFMNMENRIIRNVFMPSLICVCMTSCSDEASCPVIDSGMVEVEYVIESPEVFGNMDVSKSVLPEADDQVIHSAFLAFYDENGLLQAECDASRNGSVTLDSGRTYNVYFLANLKIDGIPAGASAEEADMSSYTYRMDGMDGRERIDDIAGNGIPMVWSQKSWKPSQSMIHVKPRKLFSKVALTIDKSCLVGSDTAVDIQDLKIRSNVVLKPFMTAVAAESASDMAETGIDYDGGTIVSGDDDMRFVVYVPENMQGNLSGGNLSSQDKKPSSEKEAVCSRVTCTAKVETPSLSVYADYQFYIGKDASQNYDLERNCLYDVTMTLDPEHIFNPTWQVNPSIMVDNRDIVLCHPVSGASLPAEGQVLAIRENRPAQFRLKVNGVDALEAVNVNPDSNYSKLDMACWSSDVFCPDKSKAPVYKILADNGITLEMDASTGVFRAQVTDPSKFLPGKDLVARFWLMPDRKREVSVIFRTMEPMSFTMDTQNFYFGMSREVNLSGFCGNVKLRSKPGDDCQLRISNTPFTPGDGYFVTENGVQGSGRSVTVYAYMYADNYTLSVTSDDDLNDSGFEPGRTFDIMKPQLRLRKPDIFLPVDGEPRNPEAYYLTTGNVEMQLSDFDAAVYAQCLQPQYSLKFEKAAYADCICSGEEGVYLCSMPEKPNAEYYQRNLLPLARFGAISKVGDISSGTTGHVDTQYPRWENSSLNFQSFSSDYFNSYSKAGSWPTIEGTRLAMYVEDCIHTEFIPVSGELHDIRGSRIAITGDRTHGNRSQVFFEYAPMDPEYVAAGTPGSPLIAPYGPMSFAFHIRNIHSGETFSLGSKSFILSHEAELSAYLKAKPHETAANMYFGTPMTLMAYARSLYDNSSAGSSFGYGNITDIYGFYITYHGSVVNGSTGKYPGAEYGGNVPENELIVMSNEEIYAGAFGYGNQEGASWDEFRYQEWNKSHLINDVPIYNNGSLGETYGWPQSIYFYDKNRVEKYSWTLPDYVFDENNSYPGLKYYLTIRSDGRPKIIDWEFIE